ncbi:conserved hypothetical protein [uncultured Desulfatiglans sp.]|uniref:TonB C-terminal domain-containing protein n=1 Tax=Uncultured Desulfatiglans sp. TaxID=1748965 RepID=A0A653ACZ0_UNCDX|nr:conserved hypothetical protein [uncultured Desulfatiglans sp.]
MTNSIPPVGKKKKPNWLLRSLILVSLGVHTILFFHIAGIYRSSVLEYIELTVQDIPKSITRHIPRPRLRPPPPEPRDLQRPTVQQRPIPSVAPMKVEPVDTQAPDSLVERIAVPRVPGAPSVRVDRWASPVIEEPSLEFNSHAAYLELVRLKIERQKKYPEAAKAMQIQGRVKVKFVITLDGNIQDLEIVESSRHADLDTAALRAVREAAPFPKPPASLFTQEIPLVFTAVFELI